jgi:rod shape-determining protein MreC
VTIDAGSRDGIAPDETVLNGDGLVGTVTATTGTTATVQLATDASATVGVRTTDTNQTGALTGTGQTMTGPQNMRVTLFSSTAVLQPGETLVTFGSVGGRPYVPGVPVGQVVSVTSQPGTLTQSALVQPFVDFTGLGVVGVVTSR